MTRKDDNRDQASGGETTWTNTGATRYGRGQHKTGSFGDDMLRPSPNHGTQRMPNDDDHDDVHYTPVLDECVHLQSRVDRHVKSIIIFLLMQNIDFLSSVLLPSEAMRAVLPSSE